MSKSPFTNEIKHMEPPWKFNPSHFTLFKRDEDSDKHLLHYQNAMTLYYINDALICKIFTTAFQGEAQDWFHSLPPHLIWNFNELSLVFTKEYLSYCLIKKKSDHLFNMKNDPNESLRTYIKRFKAEKRKIIGCNDNIACLAFRKWLIIDHPLFGELIMGQNLTLQASQEDGIKVNNALADESGWKPEKNVKHIILDPHQPEKTARIGSGLSPKKKGELMVFLRENHDVFAWSPSDMPDIDPTITC
ncbi:uncharacterized protein [Pyrus communis]|uniref:uncharacterized protein n=1 Tax=Pyrus communis TaxID=23211 RepID=UPI0035BFFA88